MGRAVKGLLVVLILSLASAAAAQVSLTFDKTAVSDRVWIGTVSGDITGTLVTTMVAADQSQPVWQVDLYWIILADDPSQSFVARLEGTLNSETGEVQMSGMVDEGYQAGASVEERGQLQNAETSNFTGTIELSGTTARAPDAGLRLVSRREVCAFYVPPTLAGVLTEC